MPDFDTRTPPGSDQPAKVHSWSNATKQRIRLIAEMLRGLFIAGGRRITPLAHRFRVMLVATWPRNLLVGGGILLFLAVVSVGFLINASIGTGGRQEAASSGQGKGAGSEAGAIFVRKGQPTKSVELGDVGSGDLTFRKGSGEIWVITERDSEPSRLTQERKSYSDASLSTDGEKIAFATGGGEGVPARIYVMDADGSDKTPVFDAAGVQVSEPVWQP